MEFFGLCNAFLGFRGSVAGRGDCKTLLHEKRKGSELWRTHSKSKTALPLAPPPGELYDRLWVSQGGIIGGNFSDTSEIRVTQQKSKNHQNKNGSFYAIKLRVW